jgi:outer membrane immunogenic protein
MKKFTLTLVMFSACCALAYAGPEPMASKEIAPVPAPPPSCFEGWYAGIHGGGIWAKLDEETFVFEETVSPAGASESAFDRTRNDDETSWEAGFHGGYNWQRGNWVFGLEVDLSATNVERHDFATVSFALPPGALFPFSTTIGSKTELDWFSTGRLRAGYVLGERFMIFGTGGGAVGLGGVSEVTALSGNTPVGGAVTGVSSRDDKDVRGGWTAGGGIDICLSQHWMLNFTYLYVDLGDSSARSFIFGTTGQGRTFEGDTRVEADMKFHVFRGGLTFHF